MVPDILRAFYGFALATAELLCAFSIFVEMIFTNRTKVRKINIDNSNFSHPNQTECLTCSGTKVFYTKKERDVNAGKN